MFSCPHVFPSRVKEPVREIEVEILPPGAIPHARRPSEREREREPEIRIYTQQPPPLAGSSSADGRAEFNDPFIALVARLMDNVFTIPGTRIRFGFDPIIGLVAGYGDAATAVTSLLLLWRSLKHGLPKIVLAQMALNIVLNTTLGAIPGLGDAFSFWFKSNERNYELLRKHAGSANPSTRPSWIFVLALVGGVGLVMALTIAAYASMLVLIVKSLSGGR